MRKLHVSLAAAALTAVLSGSAFAQSAPGAADTVGRPTGGTQIQSVDGDGMIKSQKMEKSGMAKDKMAKDKMMKEKGTTGQGSTPANPSLPDASDARK